MSKLWQKSYELNKLLEKFTVGNDYILDMKLIPSDCFASLAHAQMLSHIGILSSSEISAIKESMNELLQTYEKGDFVIKLQDEDGHTAIEAFLTEKTGDAGKKIHTGRSRNDQVITALRVYTRSYLLRLSENLGALSSLLLDFAEAHKNVPMPGRTHMQIAMPSSVGLWAASFGEDIADLASLVSSIYPYIDQNPLGSAASYGVPLPLDRQQTADLMGFARVQNNVLYVNNSRGRTESLVVDILDQIALSFSKIAQDLILFSMPEFAYFSLPDELCSGSSIMPQKKNPDGLELMRARAAGISASSMHIKSIIRSLPSGYNRDFQDTKEPFLNSCESILLCSDIISLTFSSLVVNEDKLRAGFFPEIYATDEAIRLVAEGMPFRDAYKKVGLSLDSLAEKDPADCISDRTHQGSTGNLNLGQARSLLNELEALRLEREKKISLALESLGLADLVLIQ